MNTRIENNHLIIEQSYDLSGGLYLEGTAITQLPDGLTVGGGVYR